jgi:hypothetical protein
MGEVAPFYRKGDVVIVQIGNVIARFVVVSARMQGGELRIVGANSNFGAAFKASQIISKDNPLFPSEMPEAS